MILTDREIQIYISRGLITLDPEPDKATEDEMLHHYMTDAMRFKTAGKAYKEADKFKKNYPGITFEVREYIDGFFVLIKDLPTEQFPENAYPNGNGWLQPQPAPAKRRMK